MQNQRFGTKLTHWAGGLGLAIALALTGNAAWAAGGGAGTGKKADISTKGYDYYLSGSPLNQQPALPNSQMTVLMGGGEDVDDAFKDMMRRAGCDPDASSPAGIPLDIVVIRASGADGYNPYLMDLGKSCADSVETLVIKDPSAISDPNSFVKQKVAAADILFIAGGDQSVYINQWSGTPLEAAIKTLVAKKVPIGGTSAGMAVLGRVDYSGENGSITSDEALSNPYNRRLTLRTELLDQIPFLGNTITDTHLFERDRMGRLLTFMARMGKDGTGGVSWTSARAIGVSQATALVIDGDTATVRYKDMPGAPSWQSVYFLNWLVSSEQGFTIQEKTPLTTPGSAMQVQKLTGCTGCRFKLGNWSGTGTTSYQLQVNSGVMTSSQNGGSAY